MRAARVTRRAAMAVQEGISTFLAIAGVVAIVIGLLYLLDGRALLHVPGGAPAHTAAHHGGRAAACLLGGAAAVAVARLSWPRRRP